MIWVQLQSILAGIAQTFVERVLNSLPEGLLIALFAWLLLRVAGRQNAGTRFAVWITALFAVAALPFLAGLSPITHHGHPLPIAVLQPRITVPLFWIVPVCTVWAAGMFIGIARLAVGLWHIRAIRKSSTVIEPAQLDASLQESMRKALEESGVSRPVIIAESERVRTPAAIGFWKPMIVFPSWVLRDFPADELYVILIHELAHVRRRDDWTNLLQKTVRTIFFFHPAVWWIDARLSLEREMACDDVVLAKTGNPRAYASCLVELLEKSCARRKWTMAQAAVHRAHEASLRIAQILDPRRQTTTRVWKIAPGIAGIFSVACLGVLLYSPRLMVFLPEITAQKVPVTNLDYTTAIDTPVTPRAAVVPAAFHFDTPAMRTAPAQLHTSAHVTKKDAPATHSTGAHARVSVKPLLKKTNLQGRLTAPIVVFVNATEFEAGTVGAYPASHKRRMQSEPDQDGLVHTTRDKNLNRQIWTIQVWRVVWLAPAQANVKGSSI
ncbi:MAG TPA: M56 family metallopeptidase [Pseudacidobacterium sp.]|jgi:beta-lactamase regulating signal transducer with metallopeptidase domain|nr:M56 family metallopeptidase [Pseudacidobacterium sp.]